MQIRKKLLMLLLLIALVPLVAVSWYGQWTTRRLGRDIASRTRTVLEDLAAAKLVRISEDYAAILRRDGDLIELALRFQASEIERRLAGDAPPVDEGRIWFARAYDGAGPVPADAGPGSARRLRRAANGELEPMVLSLTTSAFWIAPGVSEEAVRDDLSRLGTMADAYRQVCEGQGDVFHWQYVALESGLHNTFPGHGGYPETFDPRRRDWYRNAMQAGGAIWNPPIVDASTGEVTITLSRPVLGPDGSAVGVTAIDLRLADFMQQLAGPAEWGEEVESLIVARRPGEDLLRVLGQFDYITAEPSWDVAIEVKKIDVAAPGFEGMLEDLAAGRSGVVRLRYEGRDCLWGYGSVETQGAAFLMIVPHAAIVAEAGRAEESVLAQTRRHLTATALIFLAVVGIVVAVAYRGSAAVTRPIRRLRAASVRLARGHFGQRVNVPTGDELEELADAFNDMAPKLSDRLRIREALKLAQEVQQHLLPDHPPDLPGFEIAGTSIYCDETGGDYYDYLELPEYGPDTIGIAVGDVTGHGIAPALLMATARALLRSRAGTHTDLAALMGAINVDLAADSVAGRFMSLFYIVIDAPRLRARWVTAGHGPAISYDPALGSFSELGGPDVPLGIDPDWTFSEQAREGFAAGEILLIGTDGIWETRNADGREFGKQALHEVIRAHAAGNAGSIQRAVCEAIARFRGARPQEDDVTLVVVKHVGGEGS